MKTMRLIALLSLLSISAAFGHAEVRSQTNTVDLTPGKPVERELARNDTHTYRVELKSGQVLYAVVDQKGIDVIVTVLGPDGKQISEIDSPNGDRGPEPVVINAEASGSYRIVVRPLEESKNGRYEIRIEKLLPAAVSLTDKVDRLFIAWDKPDSPGCALIVIKDGKVIYKRGYGTANLEYDVPIDKQSRP